MAGKPQTAIEKFFTPFYAVAITPDSNVSSDALFEGQDWQNLAFGFKSLTATRTLSLPSSPTTGMVVLAYDEDGSGAQGVTVDGNGALIATPFGTNPTAVAIGAAGGSMLLLFDGIVWVAIGGGAGGGGVSGWLRKSANYTGQAGDGPVIADTSGGAWTYTFPVSPVDGQVVTLKSKGWGTHSLTLQANGAGQKIENPYALETYSAGGGTQVLSAPGVVTFKWGQTEGTWLVI